MKARLTTADLAKLWDVDRTTVYRMNARGEIPPEAVTWSGRNAKFLSEVLIAKGWLKIDAAKIAHG